MPRKTSVDHFRTFPRVLLNRENKPPLHHSKVERLLLEHGKLIRAASQKHIAKRLGIPIEQVRRILLVKGEKYDRIFDLIERVRMTLSAIGCWILLCFGHGRE